jgi:alginate O-acetyltransferase complex protein AlgI
MLLVVVGWAFFCYPDVSYGPDFVSALLGQAAGGVADSRFLYLLLTHLLLFVVAFVGSTSLPGRLVRGAINRIKTERLRFAVTLQLTGIFAALCLLLSITYLVSDSYNPFLYFRF